MKIDQKYRPELCVSTDDLRYNLQDPYLDAGAKRLVATDGASLVAVPVEVAEDERSGFVSRHLLRLARRWFRREFRGAAESVPVEIVGDRVVPNGPSYPTEREGRPSFCPWQGAVPQRSKGDPGTVTIGLDAFLLKRIALALGGEDRPAGCQIAVTIDVTDNFSPFVVRFGEDEAAVGVLMPVRFSTEHGGVWFVPAVVPAEAPPATAPPPPDAVYDAVKYALDRVQEDADFGYHAGFGTEVFHRLVKAEAAHLGRPLEEVEAQRRKTAWRGEPRVEQLRKRVAELEAQGG